MHYAGPMTAPEPPSGVGLTSLGVARVRARESTRPDRLFDDPFAAAFVAAAPDAFPEARRPNATQRSVGADFATHAVLRTRYYDEYLIAASAAGIRQVVLLAAGLDTRAYRLPWPDGVRLSEVDLPEVLEFKDKVLAGETPRCVRATVPADLRHDWSVPGFDATAPTAWLAEGLLIYLTHETAERLLTHVTALSAPGSQIAVEHGTGDPSALVARARHDSSMSRYTPLWRGGLHVDTADWLREHGWHPTVHRLSDLAVRYGRPLRGESASGLLNAVR